MFKTKIETLRKFVIEAKQNCKQKRILLRILSLYGSWIENKEEEKEMNCHFSSPSNTIS
jgi:hypothetical protein